MPVQSSPILQFEIAHPYRCIAIRFDNTDPSVEKELARTLLFINLYRYDQTRNGHRKIRGTKSTLPQGLDRLQFLVWEVESRLRSNTYAPEPKLRARPVLPRPFVIPSAS